MIGLYVFFFLFLYAFIFFKLAKWLTAKVNGFFKKLFVFSGVMAVAFVVLLGDHYFGMYRFHSICEKESGLKIFAKKSKPDGVLFETGLYEEGALNKIQKYELKFVERRVGSTNYFVNGKYTNQDDVARYAVDEYGKIGKSIHHDYLSEYVLSFKDNPIIDAVQRRETLLSEVASKKVVAAYYQYLYFGGWYVNHMLPRGMVMECPNAPKYLEREESIIQAVFGEHK